MGVRAENERVSERYLCPPHWVGVWPELQPAHERDKFGGGLAPQQGAGGRWALVHAEVSALRQVLVPGLTASVLDLPNQFAKGLHACFEAFRVERMGCFSFCDRNGLLLEDPAAIHEVSDLVPRNRMVTFLVDQCPGCSVHARVAGQRSVVEIDREPPRQSEDLVRYDMHVGDAEQIIEWYRLERGHQIFPWVQRSDVPLPGPANDLGV